MKTMETTIFNGSNAVISPSSVESAIISDLSPNIPVYTILPYFYEDNDIYAFTKQDFSCRKDILFIGGFPHLPNVSSVKYIISDIMPNVWKKYPDSKLYVVGYAPPKEILDLANDNVIVTGSVSTLDEYFKLAKVFLAPLTYGAGIKGKIVQAMQNGIPVVTNDVGIEGFENIHIGKDIFVSNDTNELIDMTTNLLANNELCETTSKNAAKYIKNNFSYTAAKTSIFNIFN